jgi:ribosome biogenesis GTPase
MMPVAISWNCCVKHLDEFGWNGHWQQVLAREGGSDLEAVGRVVQEHKEAYLVRAAMGNAWAEISGKMRHVGVVRSDFPAVGDWVLLRGLEHAREAQEVSGPVQIVKILPRRTVLARRVDAGHEQVLAVNVDVAFLGTSLNENFNVRRLERYLTLAREAGVKPVILLTKADLCENPVPYLEEVALMAGPDGQAEVAVHAISVVTGQGLHDVRDHLKGGVTGVVLGSSGIGKSTLVNHLAEADIQDMMESREFDDKGRHCTTFRHLVRTRAGGLIIDTPGLRGLVLGEATDALAATFADLQTLAATCRFTDCAHDTEPGCAIKGALEAGTLTPERLEAYLRLQREVAAMARRENRVEERKAKKLEKRLNAESNKRLKQKWGDRYRR